jgi:hypothetical protein
LAFRVQPEAHVRKNRNADRDLVGKPEDKKQFGRTNIKINLIFTLLLKKGGAKAWMDLHGSEDNKGGLLRTWY